MGMPRKIVATKISADRAPERVNLNSDFREALVVAE
jgi:hypothetical protein